jgi:hypothetical protein
VQHGGDADPGGGAWGWRRWRASSRPPPSSRGRRSRAFSARSISRSLSGLTMTFTTAAFDRSSSSRFEASSYKAAPKGPPPSLVQQDACAPSCHNPLIEPDVQISCIRLSDKTSRLRPRHVVPEPAQAYESKVPVEVRGWIAPAPPDLVLPAQPPAAIPFSRWLCTCRLSVWRAARES